MAEERAKYGIKDPDQLMRESIQIQAPMTSPPKRSIRDPARIECVNVDGSASQTISPDKSANLINNSTQFKGMKNSSILQNTPATQAHTDQKRQDKGDVSLGQMSQVRDFSIRDSPTKDSDIEFQASDSNKMRANQSIQKRSLADSDSQPMQAAVPLDDRVSDVGESSCNTSYRNQFEEIQACRLT